MLDTIMWLFDIIIWLIDHIWLILKIIVAIFVIAFIWGIVRGIKIDMIKLPDFPQHTKNGQLLKTVEFVLSGVNHIHDNSDPQNIITPELKGKWLTLKADINNEYDTSAVKVLCDGKYIGWLPASRTTDEQSHAKQLIFDKLKNGIEVLARFDSVQTVQIGGYDLDDLDPDIDKHIFNSAVVTCGIYGISLSKC